MRLRRPLANPEVKSVGHPEPHLLDQLHITSTCKAELVQKRMHIKVIENMVGPRAWPRRPTTYQYTLYSKLASACRAPTLPIQRPWLQHSSQKAPIAPNPPPTDTKVECLTRRKSHAVRSTGPYSDMMYFVRVCKPSDTENDRRDLSCGRIWWKKWWKNVKHYENFHKNWGARDLERIKA